MVLSKEIKKSIARASWTDRELCVSRITRLTSQEGSDMVAFKRVGGEKGGVKGEFNPIPYVE